MSPLYKGRVSALCFIVLVTLVAALPARAQIDYLDARRALDLWPDPIERSPRLLGMGRLTLVLPDNHSRITMWDFARNPTGILDADSTSTFDVRPGGYSSAAAEDFRETARSGEAQSFAGRENRLGYEVWRRSKKSLAVGATGTVGGLHYDQPFNTTTERRSSFSEPSIVPVLNGRMPYLLTERMQYAMRVIFASQTFSDEYRSEVTNAAGDYIDRDGTLGDPPNYFIPTDRHVRSTGAGLAFSYRFAPWLTAAAGGDWMRDKIEVSNVGDKHDAHYDESRPYMHWQLSALGALGHQLEYGVDYRTWNSESDENYVFTLSTGIGGTPVAGRGDMLSRSEDGNALRTRARWVSGRFELGAAYNAWNRSIDITPKATTDPTSFNAFLNTLYYQQRASDVVLPDSITKNHLEDDTWEFVGAAGWRLSNRTSLGAEYHDMSDELQQSLSGTGPRREMWDMRLGLEQVLTPILTGRAGYIYRSDDRDALTEQNEYSSNSVTGGLGLQPPGATWTFDLGYLFEWGQADYGSPATPHFTRQQLGAQVRWTF